LSEHVAGRQPGLFLLAVLLGLSSIVRYIPHAVLSGILVSAGLSIIDYRSLTHLFRAPRGDAWVMMIVVVLTIFTDLITAVGTGAVLASLIFTNVEEKISTLVRRLRLSDD
jgi:MFS superfamily sulfate permease-like transporter